MFGHVYCGQTDGLIKLPFGTGIGLSPNDIVLHGDPAPTKKGTTPNFRLMFIVAKRLYVSGYQLVQR